MPPLGLLHEEELGYEGDLVRECGLAARQRQVPAHAEGGAVELRLEPEAEPLAPVGIRQRLGRAAGQLDRLRHALDRDLAANRQLVAGLDLARGEAELRVAPGVEEGGPLQVRSQVLVLYVDARDLRPPVQT